jgi:hypothetical protein
MRIGRILLALLVIVLGVEIGAGIYEARVLVPLWSSDPPRSLVAYNLQPLRPNPGLRFWIFSTPLVGLLGLANLAPAFRSVPPGRAWWITGSLLAVALVVVTFVYFVPEVVAFEALRDPGAVSMASRVQRWVALNWVRTAVYIFAWLSCLRALSLQSTETPAKGSVPHNPINV